MCVCVCVCVCLSICLSVCQAVSGVCLQVIVAIVAHSVEPVQWTGTTEGRAQPENGWGGVAGRLRVSANVVCTRVMSNTKRMPKQATHCMPKQAALC